MRRAYLSEDPLVNELIATLERSITRLQSASELLVTHATLIDENLVIRMPVATFRDLGTVRRIQEPHRRLAAGASGALPASALVPPALALMAPGSGMVLLISGDPVYGANLDEALQHAGYTVTLVATAADGIDLARRMRPDLLILDLNLGNHSASVAQVLSEDPDTKTLPMLMLGRRTNTDDLPVSPPNQLLERSAPLGTILAAVKQVIAAGYKQPEIHPQILIVDDEGDIRHLVALQLEGENYRTTAVGSGTEALYIAQQQPFDLIILDLMLPDLDGFTVLGGLRAQPRTALTPIILLSALDAPREKVRGLQLGADDYVTKPFSGPELSARVQAAMRRRELEGSANPSTRLPGNVTIEREIRRRIDQQAEFAVCYSDLDNFKAYNDTYSFLKGDALIQQTARVLMAAVREFGNPDDFVGHIGGDDFVIITTPDRVETLCRNAIARFDKIAPLFYDAEVRQRGYIESFDRQGNPACFPLVSISIAVVTNQTQPFHHPGEVAQRSIEPKKTAKRLLGSVYVIDEPPAGP